MNLTTDQAIEAFRETMRQELPHIIELQIQKAFALLAIDLEDEAERRREVARHPDNEAPFRIADGISIAAEHVRNRGSDIEVVLGDDE